MTESLARRISYRVFRRRGHDKPKARELCGLMRYRPERHDTATPDRVMRAALMVSLQETLAQAAAWRIVSEEYPNIGLGT